MGSPLNIERVRQQLRVDGNNEDELVSGLIAAATRAVEVHTGMTFSDGPTAFATEDVELASTAALMLITNWYDNRDGIAVGAAAVELPHAVTWLLWPLKRLSV